MSPFKFASAFALALGLLGLTSLSAGCWASDPCDPDHAIVDDMCVPLATLMPPMPDASASADAGVTVDADVADAPSGD